MKPAPTSAGPARIFGTARKGRIAVGYDADLTVVDLKRRETITNDWIASKCAWSPYDGVDVTGWPVGTIVRGAIVMWDGELVTPSPASRSSSWRRLRRAGDAGVSPQRLTRRSGSRAPWRACCLRRRSGR